MSMAPAVRPVLVYYAPGPVHPRNARLMAAALPGWTIRVAYEAEWPWFRPTTDTTDSDAVPLLNSRWPDTLWEDKVEAVIFSTIQPRSIPLALLQEAMTRGIPTIALEEVHQVAFNMGAINNYVLPIDHVLAASEAERDGIVAAGVPAGRVQVTGWPFYDGVTGPVAADARQQAKRRLGLDPLRPVALLALTALRESGESVKTRQRMLATAAHAGTAGWQLAIKPHPAEPMAECRRLVETYAPGARLITGVLPIRDVLIAADVLLNRGTSQVCVEALLREIPVVILDTGAPTIFHRLAPEQVASDGAALVGRLQQLAQGCAAPVPDGLRGQLLSPLPAEARAAAAARVAAIAAQRRLAADRPVMWFDLALVQAWAGENSLARQAAERAEASGAGLPVVPVLRLAARRASLSDLAALRHAVGTRFTAHVVRALWARQAASSSRRPSDDDLRWMAGYPPSVNPAWFARDAAAWAHVLLRSGCAASASSLAERFQRELAWIPEFERLSAQMAAYSRGLPGRAAYAWHRLAAASRGTASRVKRRMILAAAGKP